MTPGSLTRWLVHAFVLLSVAKNTHCQGSAINVGPDGPASNSVTVVSAPAQSPVSLVSVPGVVASLFPVIPGSFRTAASNAAVDWNIALQWVLRVSNSTNVASRAFGITSLGIWQALQANLQEAEPVNATAVAGYAAYNLMINQFPAYFPLYGALLGEQLEGISDEERQRADQIATPIVVALLASRLDDGFQTPYQPPPTSAGPGQFQDVGTGTFRNVPQYAVTRPLLLPADVSSIEFVANFTPPAVLDSDAYNTELTTTQLLGSNSSVVRTLDQTLTALFWTDGGDGTTGIAGHWNQLVLATMPANITLEDSAALLAKTNVAIFDATILIWHLKYTFKRWRPITAIREGDAMHAAVPNWIPLTVTPNNPSYPSVQGSFAGSTSLLLSEFYGRDAYPFSLGTEVRVAGYTLQSRTYASFSFATAEVTQSRYFGGIEHPEDAQAGKVVGQFVAEYVLDFFEDVLSP